MSLALSSPLSPEEHIQAQAALWALLSRQARLYAPESSSLSAETTAALAESILFTLDGLQNPRVLLSGDLESRFQAGRRRLEQKIALGKGLWETACSTLPPYENRFLADTLRSIGKGLNRYDFRFFAQKVPCDIDYQLSQPVPETQLGIDYVNEYLQRLYVELAFLSQFPPAFAAAVLQESCPDYRGLLINLFEPVAVNALGLSLLDQPPQPLSVSPRQRRQLEAALFPLADSQIDALLIQAAAALCAALSIHAGRSAAYLTETALRLRPRLRAAIDGGTLEYVFLTIPHQ